MAACYVKVASSSDTITLYPSPAIVLQASVKPITKLLFRVKGEKTILDIYAQVSSLYPRGLGYVLYPMEDGAEPLLDLEKEVREYKNEFKLVFQPEIYEPLRVQIMRRVTQYKISRIGKQKERNEEKIRDLEEQIAKIRDQLDKDDQKIHDLRESMNSIDESPTPDYAQLQNPTPQPPAPRYSASWPRKELNAAAKKLGLKGYSSKSKTNQDVVDMITEKLRTG